MTRFRSSLAGLLTLLVLEAAPASAGVVVNMPPAPAPAAAATPADDATPAPTVGEVALHRYARSRTGTTFNGSGPWGPWGWRGAWSDPRFRSYRQFFGPTYPWYNPLGAAWWPPLWGGWGGWGWGRRGGFGISIGFTGVGQRCGW
jgi:hypothetical protein